ncbi:MAG TPA: hypothetical protein VGK89_02740 [Candidatus Eisenbacteria bacterium]|jgi:hypothetical protein
MTKRLLVLAMTLSTAVIVANRSASADEFSPDFFIGTSTIMTVPGETETDCNFNGTAIPCGRTIWFSAVGKLKTPGLVPVTVYALNQHIQFTANSVNYDLNVPDGATTWDPLATTATTTFTGANTWATVVPATASGNQFYAGLAFEVPCPDGLPGSIHPVAWTVSFFADKPGVTVDWTWSAAVYTSFTNNYNALGVKASDSNQYPPYTNSHHAGSPENYTSFAVGGATGGGGSNFTGSLCSSHGVPDLPVPTRLSTWGQLKLIYR